jgi:NitT/TauT family transport system substrate-binding protein
MSRLSKVLLVATLVLLSSALLAGCGQPSTPVAPETVTLAMGYIPNVQFAPFYVAVEKGYFAEEGIQINFDYGWETDLLKLVGSDELQFAIASGDQVILARSQGLPVVYVMDWYRRFPVCIVSLAETGIHQPADLAGKRVGTPATYGASYIGWRALLEATGLDEADMELVSIGYTQVAALTEHQVAAALCYAMNEPVQMQAAGESVNIIDVADYANLVSNGLITNEKTANEQSTLVQGMVRAALKGLAYTIDHPDEAFQICVKYVPEVASDAEAETVNRAVLDKSIEFWKTGDEALGRSSEAEWLASQQIMQKMGLVDGQGDVTAMFTNQFVVNAQP